MVCDIRSLLKVGTLQNGFKFSHNAWEIHTVSSYWTTSTNKINVTE